MPLTRWRTAALLAVVLALAAALRLPALAARPMHADEAIHADRVGTLVAGGGYAYDPQEYHGPTLFYLAAAAAALRGQRTYAELDEVTLRLVPAVLGLALVAVHLAFAPFVGRGAALAGALLAALSPAMAYYSRYFIHEMALVLWSLGALLAGAHYQRRPSRAAAVAGGACAGLMIATKETAAIALASMAVAFAAASLPRRGEAGGRAPERRRVAHDLLLALAVAGAVAAVFFSSFFTRPAGLLDALRAYGYYLDRGRSWSWHAHPWHYYLGLLLRFPPSGTPLFSEALVVALSAAGVLALGRSGKPAEARRLGEAEAATPGSLPDPRAVRFFSVYALLMLVAYSAIPYKTPWCVLGFVDGMALLGGVGAAAIVRASPGRGAKAVVVALLLAGGTHLGVQARAACFAYAADPRNPWVYAHTSPDVFAIAGEVLALSRAHPDGLAMPVQVISQENVWPLPWYLRRLTRVEWWRGVSDDAPPAPVILATPEMEPALVRRLYELPPPGERELYVSIYERPMSLRPAVEVRGYAAHSLREKQRQREAP